MKDGGPAFGGSYTYESDGEFEPRGTKTAFVKGLSIRDYFAASVVTGLIPQIGERDNWYGELSKRAYKLADAMLNERNKT